MITKKFMMSFLPYDYEGIEKKLSEKSSEGWQLVKAGEMYWTFVQGERNEFQYNVTYVPSASEYCAEDSEHQLTLDDYCADAGWERVCNYRKIHIYRNRNPLAVPIDTDEAQKLQMIHLAVKKWVLFPSWLEIVFFILLLLSVIVAFFTRNEPMTLEVGRLIVFPILVIVSKGIEIINYYVWFFQSKKSIVASGKCCSTKRADMINNMNMILSGVLILWVAVIQDIKTSQAISEFIFILGVVLFYQLHASWIKKLCRYIGWPAMVNRIFTIVCSVILSIYSSAFLWAIMVVRGILPSL